MLDNLEMLEIYKNEQNGNILEFECLAELREFDSTYHNDTGCRIMEKISASLNITQSKITGIQNVSNDAFNFIVQGKKYTFRNNEIKSL